MFLFVPRERVKDVRPRSRMRVCVGVCVCVSLHVRAFVHVCICAHAFLRAMRLRIWEVSGFCDSQSAGELACARVRSKGEAPMVCCCLRLL